jgi:SAM-dependent methyltransferase
VPQLPPLVLLVLAQGCGLLLLKLISPLLPETIYVHLLLHGIFAAVAGHLLGLARWWLPINLLLPLAVVLTLSLHLPSWVFLLGFLLLLLLQWNSNTEQVPLYLSNRKTWEVLEHLLPHHDIRFVDLGSGLGGTLFHLAERHPQGQFVGIESAPLPYAISRIRLAVNRLKNVELRYGNFWKVDLSSYNVLYAFLSPVPMQRLYDKAHTEMKEGSLFISNSFGVPDHPAEHIHRVNDRRKTQLHCWRIKG